MENDDKIIRVQRRKIDRKELFPRRKIEVKNRLVNIYARHNFFGTSQGLILYVKQLFIFFGMVGRLVFIKRMDIAHALQRKIHKFPESFFIALQIV